MSFKKAIKYVVVGFVALNVVGCVGSALMGGDTPEAAAARKARRAAEAEITKQEDACDTARDAIHDALLVRQVEVNNTNKALYERGIRAGYSAERAQLEADDMTTPWMDKNYAERQQLDTIYDQCIANIKR